MEVLDVANATRISLFSKIEEYLDLHRKAMISFLDIIKQGPGGCVIEGLGLILECQVSDMLYATVPAFDSWTEPDRYMLPYQ